MSESDWWYIDLCLLILYLGLATFALLQDVSGIVRVALAIPLILVAPGYALVAAFYPDEGGEHKSFDERQTGLNDPVPPAQGVDRIERLALSIVFSVVIVPAVALVASASPWGVSVRPVLLGVALVTLICSFVAILTRWRCEPERRFYPIPTSGMLLSGSGPGIRTRNVTIYNIAIVLSLLLLVGSIGYAVVEEPREAGFTEFHADTEAVSGDIETQYHAEYAAGESDTLTVHITNQEHQRMEYTTVVLLQHVSYDNESATVHAEDELARESVGVDDGEQYEQSIEITPTMAEDDVRLLVLLYDGDVPDDPSIDNAYRDLSLPIVVQ